MSDGTSGTEHYLQFEYDNSNRISKVYDQRRANDANSPEVQYTYDTTTGDLTSVKDVIGNIWTYKYKPGTHLLASVTVSNSSTDPLGHIVEEQDYDAQWRVTQQRNGLGNAVVNLSYTSDTQIIVTDGNNNPKTYSYSDSGAFAGIGFTYGTGNHNTSIPPQM